MYNFEIKEWIYLRRAIALVYSVEVHIIYAHMYHIHLLPYITAYDNLQPLNC